MTMLQTEMKNMVVRDGVLLFTVHSYRTASYQMGSRGVKLTLRIH